MRLLRFMGFLRCVTFVLMHEICCLFVILWSLNSHMLRHNLMHLANGTWWAPVCVGFFRLLKYCTSFFFVSSLAKVTLQTQLRFNTHSNIRLKQSISILALLEIYRFNHISLSFSDSCFTIVWKSRTRASFFKIIWLSLLHNLNINYLLSYRKW